ncbi:MAG: redoxin, partial [Bacteroidales bacterium]|nr:redoxin [Bacteroidales bacterium]
MYRLKDIVITFTFVVFLVISLEAQEHREPATLAIGSRAPEFRLKGIDNKTYTLKSFSRAKILVIIFSAPHCPTAQA